MKTGVLLATLLIALAFAGDFQRAAAQTPQPAPTSSPSIDPAITVRAMFWLRRFQSGTIDHAQLTQEMNSQLTAAKVKAIAQNLSALGAPIAFTPMRSVPVQGMMSYVFRVQFKTITLDEYFTLDGSGKVAGLALKQDQP